MMSMRWIEDLQGAGERLGVNDDGDWLRMKSQENYSNIPMQTGGLSLQYEPIVVWVWNVEDAYSTIEEPAEKVANLGEVGVSESRELDSCKRRDQPLRLGEHQFTISSRRQFTVTIQILDLLLVHILTLQPSGEQPPKEPGSDEIGASEVEQSIASTREST
jgi:hypothetical protein